MKLRDWLNLGVRVASTVFLLGLMAREQAKDLVRRKRKPAPVHVAIPREPVAYPVVVPSVHDDRPAVTAWSLN